MDDFMFTKESLSTLIKLMKSESSKNLDYYFIDKDFKSPKVTKTNEDEFNLNELNSYKDHIAIVNKGYAWQNGYEPLSTLNENQKISENFEQTKDEDSLTFTKNISYIPIVNEATKKLGVMISSEDQWDTNQLLKNTIIKKDENDEYSFLDMESDEDNIDIKVISSTNPSIKENFKDVKQILEQEENNPDFLLKYKYTSTTNNNLLENDKDYYYSSYETIQANDPFAHIPAFYQDGEEELEINTTNFSDVYNNEEIEFEEDSFVINTRTNFRQIQWKQDAKSKLKDIPIVTYYDGTTERTENFSLYYNETIPVQDIRFKTWNEKLSLANSDVFINSFTGQYASTKAANGTMDINGYWQQSDLNWLWNNYYISLLDKNIKENGDEDDESNINNILLSSFIGSNNKQGNPQKYQFHFVTFPKNSVDNNLYLKERAAATFNNNYQLINAIGANYSDTEAWLSNTTSATTIECDILEDENKIYSCDPKSSSISLSSTTYTNILVSETNGGSSTTATVGIEYKLIPNPSFSFSDNERINFGPRAVTTTKINNTNRLITVPFVCNYYFKKAPSTSGITNVYIIKNNFGANTASYYLLTEGTSNGTATPVVQAFHPQINYSETKYFMANTADYALGVELLENRFNNSNLFYDKDKFNNDIESEIFDITLSTTADQAAFFQAKTISNEAIKDLGFYNRHTLPSTVFPFQVTYSPILTDTDDFVYHVSFDNMTDSEIQDKYNNQEINIYYTLSYEEIDNEGNDKLLWEDSDYGENTPYNENSTIYENNGKKELKLFTCNDEETLDKVRYTLVENNNYDLDYELSNLYYIKKFTGVQTVQKKENSEGCEFEDIQIENFSDFYEYNYQDQQELLDYSITLTSDIYSNIITTKNLFNQQNITIIKVNKIDNSFEIASNISENDKIIILKTEYVLKDTIDENIISNNINNMNFYLQNYTYDQYFNEIAIGTNLDNLIEQGQKIFKLVPMYFNQQITKEQLVQHINKTKLLYNINFQEQKKQQGSGQFNITVELADWAKDALDLKFTYYNNPLYNFQSVYTASSSNVQKITNDITYYITQAEMENFITKDKKTYNVATAIMAARFGVANQVTFNAAGDELTLNGLNGVTNDPINDTYKRANYKAEDFATFFNIKMPNRSWRLSNTAITQIPISSTTRNLWYDDYQNIRYGKIKYSDFWNFEDEFYCGSYKASSASARFAITMSSTAVHHCNDNIINANNQIINYLNNPNNELLETLTNATKTINNTPYIIISATRGNDNYSNFTINILAKDTTYSKILTLNNIKYYIDNGGGTREQKEIEYKFKIRHIFDIVLQNSNYVENSLSQFSPTNFYYSTQSRVKGTNTWTSWSEWKKTTNGIMVISLPENCCYTAQTGGTSVATVNNPLMLSALPYWIPTGMKDDGDIYYNIMVEKAKSFKEYYNNPPIDGEPIFFKDWITQKLELKYITNELDNKTTYFHYIKIPDNLKITTNENYYELPFYMNYIINDEKIFDNISKDNYILISTDSIKNIISNDIYNTSNENITYTLNSNFKSPLETYSNDNKYNIYYLLANNNKTPSEYSLTELTTNNFIIDTNTKFTFYIKANDSFQSLIMKKFNKEDPTIDFKQYDINLEYQQDSIKINDNYKIEALYNYKLSVIKNTETEEQLYDLYLFNGTDEIDKTDMDKYVVASKTQIANQSIPYNQIRITLNSIDDSLFTINEKNLGARHIFIPISLNTKYTPSWNKDNMYPNANYNIDDNGILKDENGNPVELNGTFSVSGNNGGALVKIRGFNDQGEYEGKINGATISNATFGDGIITVNDTSDAERKPQIDTMTKNITIKPLKDGGNIYASIVTKGGISAAKKIKAERVFGAIWNDYAEYRETKEVEPGRCVIEQGNGKLSLSTERLQGGANIVSDTFGFGVGETSNAKTPIAVSGRVLAYPLEDRDTFNPGEAVCSGPNGTISRMTREEIKEWPDRIVGYVSEIPHYQTWGTGKIKVDGRIWIKVH